MIAHVLLRVFVILLLVAANAFFAAAEFALVSVRETRIQQLIEANRVGARTVLKLHQQLSRVVNGVQLGITVMSLTLGWLGEPVLAQMFENWIGNIPHALLYAHAVAVAVAFVLITSLHVILGELVPKSLALQRAERVALAVAAPMDVFLTITAPSHRGYEPRRRHGAAGVWDARNPARLGAFARRTQADRDGRRITPGSSLRFRKRCC